MRPDLTDDPEVAGIRAGDDQDWAALRRYLGAELDLTGPLHVRQFPHGSANLTFLVETGGRRLVVRRPPHGDLAPGAHDMAREYRVLSQLWRAYPRAPRALTFCADPTVLGAPFLVVEYRAGVVIRSAVPPAMEAAGDPAGAISAAFADAVAELHLVDPDQAGLSDLGRADDFTARQVRGWRRRWDLARPVRGASLMDEVADVLAGSVPAASRVSLVHNDLKLDNCQFADGDPTTVRSVFDWDMTTLGDPLVDIGTALSYWPDRGPAGAAARELWPGQESMGLWSRRRLRERYAERTGLDVGRVAWFEALGSWKTAVALQQLANRALRGDTLDHRLARYADVVPAAARVAADLLDQAG